MCFLFFSQLRQENYCTCLVRLNCGASGSPKPTYTWYKDGEPVELENAILLQGMTLEKSSQKTKKIGNLILQNLAWRDRSQDAEWTGTYQCVAENMLGQRSAKFSLF